MREEIGEKLDAFMRDLIREDWMDEEDLNGIMAEYYKIIPISKLIQEIEVGINNGYSIDDQLQAIKKVICQ